MPAHLRKFLIHLGETFWLLPAALTMVGIFGAVGLVHLDRIGAVPHWLIDGEWVYNGGGTGARTLLGAIAASSIGVAGTVFSITIAALSLAAGQMGPRLLRNFTRDRGVQVTLGAFLGTFSYALMVLRSVRTQDEGAFTPHLSLSVGILLAFACVATLVYFVGHMANRINVDTVVKLVSDEVSAAIERLTLQSPGPEAPAAPLWNDATLVVEARRGYLQELDAEGLADWAAEHECVVRLLVRPGDYVFPGTPIALVSGAPENVTAAVADALALGGTRISSADLEFAIRQLVEVAVRALSPGINDPHTAISVLDRLGASLCAVAPVHLHSGVYLRHERPALVMPSVDYAGLCDAMFHLIRQSATAQVSVLLRLLEVLTAVASCERAPERLAQLRRHADLVLADARRNVASVADLDDVRSRHAAFERMRTLGPRDAFAAALTS
ncbi:MAG: DUF2254 domain-containing protein [Burkholderiaceae bacterium]